MTLGPIDVSGGTETTVAAPPVTLPIQTYALVSGDLRVVVFAESPGGWDGLRIERAPGTSQVPSSRPRPRP